MVIEKSRAGPVSSEEEMIRNENQVDSEKTQILRANGFDASDEWHCHAVFYNAKNHFGTENRDVKLKLEAMAEIYNRLIDDIQYGQKTPEQLEAAIETFEYVIKVQKEAPPEKNE